MRPRQPSDARHQFVDARVVLHGAGAQRIHAEIDGVVPGGEAREVADGFHFADFRESPRSPSRTFSAPSAAAGSTAGTSSSRKLIARSCPASCARRAALRSATMCGADFSNHLRNASATASISRAARHLGGAEQHRSPPVPDRSAPSGRPPMIFFSSSASIDLVRRRAVRLHHELVEERTRRSAASPCPPDNAPWPDSARPVRADPSLP